MQGTGGLRRLALAVMLVWSFDAGASALEDKAMHEIAPTGTLRVGVAYAPSPTPVFVAKDATGDFKGVPCMLGEALAKSLGVPFELVVKATTGELTEACVAGSIDIGFMPMDEERRKRLDFSPPYFVIESTYLATEASGITTLSGVDRPEVTVVGINGSTTMRAAGRSLQNAKIVPATSVDEAMAMMKSGAVQAFALTHDSLPVLQKELPGSSILDGAFQVTGVAIALRKENPAALAFVKAFVDKAKADGTMRHAFDAAGLTSLAVAP